MEAVDVLVIGAGVVGLAVARAVAQAGREVVVCEAEKLPGQGISSRNSGVIHAGLYYPSDSLKARLCVEGANLLYKYCKEFQVPHQKLGKLVVATNEEEHLRLLQLKKNAEQSGVVGLELLAKAEAQALEPDLDVVSALYSPVSGIIDVHEYIMSLCTQVEKYGGVLACNTTVSTLKSVNDKIEVGLGVDTRSNILANTVINCTGLNAQTIASTIVANQRRSVPPLHMTRGNYFRMSGASPFKHLIYPMPVKGGLGVHATLDMGGAVRFGPDVQVCNSISYQPDESREPAFRKAVARYFPGIESRTLTADYVGIRPQLLPPGQFADFSISMECDHGVPGLVNLFGIESPGLTASVAIADYVTMVLN